MNENKKSWYMNERGDRAFKTRQPYGPDWRPAVVFDPDNSGVPRELLELYHEEYQKYVGVGRTPNRYCSHTLWRAVFRRYAAPPAPKPPKPERPDGLGAVVKDSKGGKWVLVFYEPHVSAESGGLWRKCGQGTEAFWRDIDAVEVVSKGVSVS